MVRWVIGSILHGSTELFFLPASALQLVWHKLWDGAYKGYIAVNWGRVGGSSSSGRERFPFLLSGPLPCVRCHISVNKMC